jgi:hypothetical protein
MPQTLVGKAVRCPQCKNVVRVTADAPEAPPLEAAAPPIPAPVPPPPALAEDLPYAAEAVEQRVTVARTEPAPLPVALPAAQPAPAPPRPRRRAQGAGFPSINFDLRVEHDPERQVSGRITGRVTPDGLRLFGWREQEYNLPIGTAATYLGGDRLTVEVGRREIEVKVTERGINTSRFARDLADFLNGERAAMYRSDYLPSKLPCLLAVMPLVIPLVGIALWLSGVFGAVVWALLGLVLSGICLAVLASRWSLVTRVATTVVLTLLGLVLLPALHFTFQFVGGIFDPKPNWQTYNAPDGRWSVLMAGNVKTGSEPVAGVPGLSLQKYESRTSWNRAEFMVAHIDLNAQEWARVPPDQFFANFGAELVKKDNRLRLVSTTDVMLDGKYRGRQFDLTHPQFGKLRFVLYAVPTTYYLVGAAWKSGMPDAEVEKFFASFKLAGAAQGGGQPVPGPQPGPEPQPKPGPGKSLPADPVLTPPDLRGAAPWQPLPANGLDRLPIEASQLPGVVGYWPLDEGKGTTTVDRTGKNPAAKVVGGWWVDGVRGKAVLFDGAKDYINLGDSPLLNIGDRQPFSVSLWTATKKGNGTIMNMRNAWNGAPVLDIGIRDGAFVAATRSNATEDIMPCYLKSKTVNDGRWHHVLLTRNDQGQFTLYVDGKEVGKAQNNQAAGPLTTNLRALGSERYHVTKGIGGHLYFDGAVDEFAFFTRELTPAEVKMLAGRN